MEEFGMFKEMDEQLTRYLGACDWKMRRKEQTEFKFNLSQLIYLSTF